MKTKIKLLLTSFAIGAVAFAACAQDDTNSPPPGGPGFGGPHHHRPPPLPLIQVLDANRDGIIDSNEIAGASAELLKLDKNGDGILTTNEYLPTRPANAPADDNWHPPTPLIIKALDVNGDGIIDATEIANAPAELLKLDKNGDGQLTRDEYMGKRPHPPQHREDDNGAGGPPPPEDGKGGPDGQGRPPMDQ